MILPDGWALPEWNSVVSITHGKSQKNVEATDGMYPIYGSGGVIGRANAYLCTAGSTIIGRKGTINNPIFATTDFWNIDTAFGVSPSEVVLPKLLYYFCLAFNFHSLDNSTTIPSLTQKKLLRIRMPLPPLAEQHRIVEKIDSLFYELDKGVESLQAIKQQLKNYRQAVLNSAFEGLMKKSNLVPLHTIAKDVFDGPFGSNLKTSDYTDSGVRVVRLENIKRMRFDLSKESFVTPNKYETLKRNTVAFPDVVMSTFISGEVKVCLIPESLKLAINKADCVCIRCDDVIQSKFLVYYLSTKQVYDGLFKEIHGATRPRVNTTQIKRIGVPQCSFEEQEALVRNVESLMGLCDHLESLIDGNFYKADALRQSILKKAFEGRLVPQDPNDEPAKALLERIKTERATQTASTNRRRKNA